MAQRDSSLGLLAVPAGPQGHDCNASFLSVEPPEQFGRRAVGLGTCPRVCAEDGGDRVAQSLGHGLRIDAVVDHCRGCLMAEAVQRHVVVPTVEAELAEAARRRVRPPEAAAIDRVTDTYRSTEPCSACWPAIAPNANRGDDLPDQPVARWVVATRPARQSN